MILTLKEVTSTGSWLVEIVIDDQTFMQEIIAPGDGVDHSQYLTDYGNDFLTNWRLAHDATPAPNLSVEITG